MKNNKLIATFYIQPKGSQYDVDDAFECHLYLASSDYYDKYGIGYFMLDDSCPDKHIGEWNKIPKMEECLKVGNRYFNEN